MGKASNWASAETECVQKGVANMFWKHAACQIRMGCMPIPYQSMERTPTKILKMLLSNICCIRCLQSQWPASRLYDHRFPLQGGGNPFHSFDPVCSFCDLFLDEARWAWFIIVNHLTKIFRLSLHRYCFILSVFLMEILASLTKLFV